VRALASSDSIVGALGAGVAVSRTDDESVDRLRDGPQHAVDGASSAEIGAHGSCASASGGGTSSLPATRPGNHVASMRMRSGQAVAPRPVPARRISVITW